MNQKNLSVIRQQFAQCVFNHKVQEKAVERMEGKLMKLKWTNVIILCLVLTLLVLQLKFPDKPVFGSISIAITIFEILFLYIQKEFSFEKKSTEYKKVALRYLELRDKYKNFISDVMNGLLDEKIIAKRDLLQEQYQIISELAPQTDTIDCDKAQLALFGKNNSDEEYSWSDIEIDRFLSKELRIDQNEI